MPSTRPSECLAGDDALVRGAWAEAREVFEEALAVREFPEARRDWDTQPGGSTSLNLYSVPENMLTVCT